MPGKAPTGESMYQKQRAGDEKLLIDLERKPGRVAPAGADESSHTACSRYFFSHFMAC